MTDNRNFGASRGYSGRNAYDDKGSVGSTNRGGFNRGQSNGGNRGFGNSQGAGMNDGRNPAYGQDSRRGNGFNQSAGGRSRYGNEEGNAPANVAFTEEEKARLLAFDSTPITKPSPFAAFKKPAPLPNPNINMGFFARPALPDARISGEDNKPVENVVKQAEEVVKPIEDVTDQAEVIAKPTADGAKSLEAEIIESSNGMYNREQMLSLSKAKESLVDPMVDTSFIKTKESEELLMIKAYENLAYCFPRKKNDEAANNVATAREPDVGIDEQDRKPESCTKEVAQTMLKTMLGIGQKEATGEGKQSVEPSMGQSVVDQVNQLSSVISPVNVIGLSKDDLVKLAVVMAKFSEAFIELNNFMQHMIR